jgi:hypothetical protein
MTPIGSIAKLRSRPMRFGMESIPAGPEVWA